MKKVLIVDDEVMNRDLIVKVLRKEGMEVYEAKDGKEALTAIALNRFDLVLMDLMMPVMDGFETIEAIRTRSHQQMPIVTLSAINDKRSIVRALALGADDYLTKPYDLREMLKVVKGALDAGNI